MAEPVSVENTGMACPACGAELKRKKSVRVSVSDLVGATIVGLFLVGVLVLVIRAMGPWELAFAVGFAVIAAVLVLSGEGKELGKPTYRSGAYTEGSMVGGLLFLLGVLVRFFVRYEVRTHDVCSRCGYRGPEDRSPG
jgi:predicted RNA-binding Zn-ribbon protein involved in translation (DUF1610 family)